MTNLQPAGEQPAVLRLAAFARDGVGGNPAGVVLDARALSEQQMLALAAQVGYSETVFVTDGPPEPDRRPLPGALLLSAGRGAFCGHATIALGAAFGRVLGAGDLVLDTAAGQLSLRTGQQPSGQWCTRLASVPPASSRCRRPCCSERWTASAGPPTSCSRACRRCSASPAPGTSR